MKTIELITPPTPEQVREARLKAGLTQRQASEMVFGAHSIRCWQNHETGARKPTHGTYILFLLMTDQVTLEQAKTASLMRVRVAKNKTRSASKETPA